MGRTYRRGGSYLSKSSHAKEDKCRGWRKKKLRSLKNGAKNKSDVREDYYPKPDTFNSNWCESDFDHKYKPNIINCPNISLDEFNIKWNGGDFEI